MANETMALIQKITVGSEVSSVSFNNIPQTFTDLIVRASARSTGGAVNADVFLNMNGNTSASNWRILQADGSGAYTANGSATNARMGVIPANSSTATVFGNVEAIISNYTSTSKKAYISDTAYSQNNTQAYQEIIIGLNTNTAAITSITMACSNQNFSQHSSFQLYGRAKQGVLPVNSTPYATGGDDIMFDGTYWIHTFRSSGTFTPKKGLTCDYLVVAGGGGAQGGGGGGGAGGLRSTVTATGGGGSLESALSVTANTAYTITVGGGGAGGNGVTPSNASGSNSSISGTGITTVTSTGGGGGADYVNGPGATGGSGGGGAWTDGSTSTYKNGGAGTANQGYAGGSGNTAGGPGSGAAAGGGGGAGAVGGNQTSGVGGNGGAGVATSITGSSVTYAGGGGGYGGSTAGTGGAGGGGAGNTGSSGIGTAGTANTGGGAGAGYDRPGAAGGSGIVIVRYAA